MPELRVVNPDRPLGMAGRLLPTLTGRKDRPLRERIITLAGNLRAADAAFYGLISDLAQGRITEDQWAERRDRAYADLVAAYDELASVVEHMPLPA